VCAIPTKYCSDACAHSCVCASSKAGGLQVFYVDTMKWFVDLYGHKLPALTLDISTDSTLLVSGSADKNLKIWGLDFGDCHKSLFAHQDSVMAVRFVPRTHYVVTAGKDGLVKYWDADKFELLLELPAHHGEARPLLHLA
jgi:U3 small nucleolar RNA-associated protein 12